MFSHWKIASLQKRTERTLSSVRAEMERTRTTAGKQEHRFRKLETTVAALRKRLADAEALGSARLANEKTVKEIMQYVHKMFPRIGSTDLVESFRKTSEMVGGDMQMLVEIASEIHSTAESQQQSTAQRVKGVLRILSVIRAEPHSATGPERVHPDAIRRVRRDARQCKKRLPEMWNRPVTRRSRRLPTWPFAREMERVSSRR